MEFVKKCKKVLGSKRLHAEENESGKLTNEEKQHYEKKNMHRVAPKGCIYVYVGPNSERFLMKIKMVNHPLFKKLLGESEREYEYDSYEYGYRNDGPLWIPCDVLLFSEALKVMESTT
ncbi:auxin-responsive protein SAUR71 [Cajanus cajan]|uniref:Indole-3-acetic acid-induced protein ARG7 n=1 Tax=Cajanus cajan TaxID=3821 RepID=A0A151RRF1_CAJCA|nr:auxin-responsive protein SAUR71 [Cajanus cajan]KYP45134.1 Indole-3-acetic acid-induced protein ARG7 [Cajanus cajan]